MPFLLSLLFALLLLGGAAQSPALADSLISGLTTNATSPLPSGSCLAVDQAASTDAKLCAGSPLAATIAGPIGALAISNNLSDLANAATARGNLGAVGLADTQTLTNKTISGAANTFSNIGNGSLTNSSVTLNGHALALGGTLSLGFSDLSGAASFAQLPAVIGPTILGRVANTSGAPSAAYTPSNGTDTTVVLAHGVITATHCAEFNDAVGTLIDSGAGCGSGGGAVTSVTGSGNISASPTTGAVIVSAPDLALSGILTTAAAVTTTGAAATTLAFPATGPVTFAFPATSKTLAASDLSNASGWPTAGDLMLSPASGAPTAYAGTTAGANQFMTGLSAAGVGTFAQPAFSNLSGAATFAQLPAVTGPAILGRVTNTSGAPSAAYTPSNGVDTTLALVHGATTSGHCPQFSDATGTIIDSGAACGGGSTTVTAGPGLGNSQTSFNGTGTAQTVTNGSTLFPQMGSYAVTAAYSINATTGTTPCTSGVLCDTARVILADGSASIAITAPNPAGTLAYYQIADESGHGFTVPTVGGTATFAGCVSGSPTTLTVPANYAVQLFDLGATANSYYCVLQFLGSVLPVANGGTGVTTTQGNGSKVQLSTGTPTGGDAVKFDVNGNTADAGFASGLTHFDIGYIAGVNLSTNPTDMSVKIPVGMTITSMIGHVGAAVGGTATIDIYEAPSGTACASGTKLTGTTNFNANGTANTDQTLAGTVSTITANDRLCLVASGAGWAASVGTGAVSVWAHP